jgi:hypothetical protein
MRGREMRFTNGRGETKWNPHRMRKGPQSYESNAGLMTYATCEGLRFFAY